MSDYTAVRAVRSRTRANEAVSGSGPTPVPPRWAASGLVGHHLDLWDRERGEQRDPMLGVLQRLLPPQPRAHALKPVREMLGYVAGADRFGGKLGCVHDVSVRVGEQQPALSHDLREVDGPRRAPRYDVSLL